MKQLVSGQIVDGFYDIFEDDELENVKSLCQSLAYFNVESKTRFEEVEEYSNPMLCVLINILERGTPTLIHKTTLDFLLQKTELLSKDNRNNQIIDVKLREEYKNLFFKSLHIVDPRLTISDLKSSYIESWEKLGSDFEENFLYQDLPAVLGDRAAPFVQLLAQQRSIKNIIKNSLSDNTISDKELENFEGQRSDFSVSFPYHQNSKGLVIEIDGSQHESWDQKKLDFSRDRAVAKAQWSPTVRIKTSEFKTPSFNHKITDINAKTNEPYIHQIVDNYKTPLWSTKAGMEALQVTLIPFGVSRLLRILLELFDKKEGFKSQKQISIAVIERDIPCADIAFAEFISMLEAINALSLSPLNVPEFKLDVFASDEFISNKFRQEKAKPIRAFDTEKSYDLLIDISLLRRQFSNEFYKANTNEIVCISSSHYDEVYRTVKTNNLMSYKPICEKATEGDKWKVIDDGAMLGLQYFLRSIFRKIDFREGQLPILHQALRCKSVIGLLPTGGGKSLTYQISAFLQPGICLVIDPIKSLMKDQVDGLNRYHIDSCAYINSSVKGDEKREYLRQLSAGELQFVFVSPERLQMAEFRDVLRTMSEDEVFFSYCVIDEAHCVSEWGHDFRTAYLQLGENAMKYCRTKNLDNLPLFGLTATASYDVLADVQRELSGNDESKRLKEDAIIRSEFSKRDELQFVIEDVNVDNSKDYDSDFSLREVLGKAKQEKCLEIISRIPEEINLYRNNPNYIYSTENWPNESEEIRFKNIVDLDTKKFFEQKSGIYPNAGLVFCPHTSFYYGVTDRFKPPGQEQFGFYDYLKDDFKLSPTFFMGGDQIFIEEASTKNQETFIKSESNLMVATKAFGMGIDKGNIRYVIHANYPSSIESYVQEAGRGGRDGHLALSYILFNDQKFNVEGRVQDHDYEINKYFHDLSFKGIAKEEAILDQLMTEVFFKDKSYVIENRIKTELGIDISCSLWEEHGLHWIYLKNQDNEDLGFINAENLMMNTSKSVNSELSKRIHKVISVLPEFKTGIFLPWFKESDKSMGILNHLSKTPMGESFSLPIGFSNDTDSIEKIVCQFIVALIPFYNGKDSVIMKIKKSNELASNFINSIENHYIKSVGNAIDFSTLCNERDKLKGHPEGFAFEQFCYLYDGKRDKADTEKAIYRLMVLGVLDDYTVNYSAKSFTVYGTKKTEEEYTSHLRKFLLKYYSAKTTDKRLSELENIVEANHIKKMFKFYVEFIYNEVKDKRVQAINDMRYACKFHIGKSKELKEYIDLYFNSKYARKGFECEIDGITRNASLTDRTDEGKEKEEKWIWEFINIVDNDRSGGGEIDNIKHLRGACTRILNSQPDNFVLQILSAFSLYNLEYKNPKQLQEAEEILTKGLINMSNYGYDTDERLQEFFNKFSKALHSRIPDLQKYLDKHNMTLDFDNLLASRYIPYLQKSSSTLRKLINQLN